MSLTDFTKLPIEDKKNQMYVCVLKGHLKT